MKTPSNLLVNALAVVGAGAAIVLVVAGGVALAGGDEDDSPRSEPATIQSSAPTVVERDDDVPLADAELDRVAAAAERIAGPSSSVVEIDRSDDLGEAYEVEVVTPQGELDVALDEHLERVPNLRYDD